MDFADCDGRFPSVDKPHVAHLCGSVDDGRGHCFTDFFAVKLAEKGEIFEGHPPNRGGDVLGCSVLKNVKRGTHVADGGEVYLTNHAVSPEINFDPLTGSDGETLIQVAIYEFREFGGESSSGVSDDAIRGKILSEIEGLSRQIESKFDAGDAGVSSIKPFLDLPYREPGCCGCSVALGAGEEPSGVSSIFEEQRVGFYFCIGEVNDASFAGVPGQDGSGITRSE